MKIPVSLGEVADRMTILEIKTTLLHQVDKVQAAEEEHQALSVIFAAADVSSDITNTVHLLVTTNLFLWHIEDRLRILEEKKDFNHEFVHLARLVYKMNDQRFALKARINLSDHNSDSPREVKSYA